MRGSDIHIHILGGPHDGKILFFDGIDGEYPEIMVIPTSKTEGEMYEVSGEEASCGSPVYLYSGYDWELLGYIYEDEE